jgi:hypothetical protein
MRAAAPAGAVAEGEEQTEGAAHVGLEPRGEAAPRALPQRWVEEVGGQHLHLWREHALAGDEPCHPRAPPQDLGSRAEGEARVLLPLERLHALANEAMQRAVRRGQ